ncbi:MAG: ROK family transcriptional regulator [Oscillospiraceae bacterium]|nr:ROK family transcriptional regulator [Oscillospiraceae bacterium]
MNQDIAAKLHNNSSKRILRALRSSNEITKKDIADKLELSLPTITNCTKFLRSMDYILECGAVDSYVGRKPSLIAINGAYCYEVGVSVSSHWAGISVVDFSGKVLTNVTVQVAFTGTAAYWKNLASSVESTVAGLDLKSSQIHAIVIARPYFYTYDHITDAAVKRRPKGMLTDEEIAEVFDKEVHFIESPQAAAFTSSWDADNDRPAVILYLDRFIGGCLVKKDESGKIITRSLPLAHITLDKNGKKCFCGNQGCAQTLISTSVIFDILNGLSPEEDSNPVVKHPKGKPIRQDEFISQLEAGNMDYLKLWDGYLSDLALFVHNLRMMYSTDIILCGDILRQMAHYKYDLCIKVEEHVPFGIKVKAADFIHTSAQPQYDVSIGAALYGCELIVDSI